MKHLLNLMSIVIRRRILLLPVVLCAAAASARAEPYWVAWEGNDYPENEGWTRFNFGDGPAERTLENGVLTIDSLWSQWISDFHRIDREVNPSSGEAFVLQWRIRVNEVIDDNSSPPVDPTVAVFSDDDWGLGFELGHDGLKGGFESDLWIPFEPDEFHSFEIRSSDMRSYELYMDGKLANVGTFWEPAVSRSFVAWGDGIRGAASSTDWDYFRFGVVPEPTTGLMFIMLSGLTRSAFSRRRLT